LGQLQYHHQKTTQILAEHLQKLLSHVERLGNFAGAGQFNFGSLAFGVARKGKEMAVRKKTLADITETKIKEITKDILAEMYIKMYVLRDHIFWVYRGIAKRF